MAVKAEKAGAAIARSARITSAAGQEIEKAFAGITGAGYSGTKVAEAYATVASELGIVEGHSLGGGAA